MMFIVLVHADDVAVHGIVDGAVGVELRLLPLLIFIVLGRADDLYSSSPRR